MRHILLTTIGLLLFVGCSDPEAEANKLYTQAAQLVKEADDSNRDNPFSEYNKRKMAIALINKIPAQYPQTSLSVRIVEGDFKLQGLSLDEIKKKMNPSELITGASWDGDIKAVKQYLDDGASISDACLEQAVANGHKEIVEMFLAKKIDVNLRGYGDYDGTKVETPLDIAIKNGHKEIAELLEKNGGIRIFHKNVWDAAYYGDIESVKGHLELGMEADARDVDGAVPDIDFFAKLYNLGHIKTLNMLSGTPLYYAALRGHKHVAELLIANGANVNAKIGDDHPIGLNIDYPKISPQSILDAASIDLPGESPQVNNVKKEIFNFLIKNGASSNKLLIHHVREGNVESVELFAHQDFVNTIYNDIGATVLHLAAQNDSKEIAGILISKGAEVNAKDNYGLIPLHKAAYFGNEEVVELLISKGSELNTMSSTGDTPLDKAINEKKTETIKLLRKHLAWTGEESRKFAAASDKQKKRDLVNYAAKGDLNSVKRYLSQGVDVYGQDNSGHTPLYQAAYYGHKEIAKLLIAKGANLNAKNNYGKTPLDAVSEKKTSETVGLFGTKMDNAIKKKRSEIADLLRKHGGKTGEELEAEGK